MRSRLAADAARMVLCRFIFVSSVVAGLLPVWFSFVVRGLLPASRRCDVVCPHRSDRVSSLPCPATVQSRRIEHAAFGGDPRRPPGSARVPYSGSSTIERRRRGRSRPTGSAKRCARMRRASRARAASPSRTIQVALPAGERAVRCRRSGRLDHVRTAARRPSAARKPSPASRQRRDRRRRATCRRRRAETRHG